MTETIRTVGALKAALAGVSDDALPISGEPPFAGVTLWPQSNGSLLIGGVAEEERLEYRRKRQLVGRHTRD